MLSPGDVIDGRYEILAPLAEGGMGAVYRARRILLGDEVAIKVVRPDLINSTARDRFLRESRIAARLRHPGVVAIFDFDMPEDAQPYLVMELLNGPSLRDEIAAKGRLDPNDVQRILPPLCAALDLAHANGIVHRDIKPANIVAHDYPDGGRVYKIVDFGIANLRQSTDDGRITGAHQFLGTVAYASPEQLTGPDVDARSDIYSLAVVIFEMLTGRAPFETADMLAAVGAKLAHGAPGLRAIRPDVPRWLDAAVARGLATQAADRWQTMREFGAALCTPDAATDARESPSSDETSLADTYQVGQLIGPGRLGSEVFHGVHRALAHPVAIRILRSDAPAWSAARARFLREAKALQIAHPSIIQVRDYGEDPGYVYLVTDFIHGRNVRRFLQDHGPISWERLAPMLGQLLEAARVVHRRKALLCGLNPEIMRIREPDPADDMSTDEGERLMISTGGISRAQDLLATLHERTLRGVALDDLELRYVAPELLTGGAVDVRSDVFTLGVLAYEMATGAPPYDGASMPELLGRMLAGTPRPPREVQPDLPAAAADAILRALSPRPADRFATVADFAKALSI